MAYTVDEVSDMLGVPRPTLYRYLREYSIPHKRRAGKISIPEESLERIRKARELHEEGLGTESVRTRLRGSGVFDAERLERRLDRLSEAVEGLQGNLTPATDVASSQTLRTILAKQNLLISATFNLTEMMEDLLAASGHPRRSTYDDDLEEEVYKRKPSSNGLEKQLDPVETVENFLRSHEAVTAPPKPKRRSTPAVRPKKFGALARRRRRSILAFLLALLASAVLIASTLLAWSGGGSAAGPQAELSSALPEVVLES